MKHVYNHPNFLRGKTIIDEYIDSLIQSTFEGTQCWHTDMSEKDLRYYYDTGQGVRIYLMQESIATETETFSLRMAYGEKFAGSMLIASEYSPYDYPNRIRELWTVVQETTSEEEDEDFDLISYINRYLIETKQKNMFHDYSLIKTILCQSIFTKDGLTFFIYFLLRNLFSVGYAHPTVDRLTQYHFLLTHILHFPKDASVLARNLPS